MDPYTIDVLWIVIVGICIAFILAFGIGANDVANSFGTSVGSGVLSIRQACWLATFCEVSGAVLIGYKVSDTMRKGILDTSLYNGSETELMLGCLSALSSSALWLLVATFLKLPISGTHSIVGSTIGFSLVARGAQGLKLQTLGKIIASWFVSPVLSGLMSCTLFWCIRKFIIRSNNPLKAGLIALPIFYGVTMFVNVFSIVLDGPKLLLMDNIPTWIALVASIGFGLLISILVHIFIVPWQRKKVLAQTHARKPVKFTFNGSSESTPSDSPKRNRRPVSLIIDGKQLPAITETTELVSFKDDLTSTLYGDLNLVARRLDINSFDKTSSGGGNKYKIDPKIIERAENMLGKESLDNTDLTITSLNFIDEHQSSNGCIGGGGGGGIGRRTMLQEFFDRQNSHRSPESLMHDKCMKSTSSPNNNNNNKREQTILPLNDYSMIESNNVTANGGDEKQELNNIESNGSLDRMISTTLSTNSSKVPLISASSTKVDSSVVTVDEPDDISTLFSFLQVLTAAFGSFAHGGNDVSNAIGPLIALWMIYKEGSVDQRSETPISLLVFGGIGISVGLWVWGRRVIKTVGHDLTKITPSTGFTIEIGAAMTVLLASKIGLPISTTHCKVGSVVFVGYANSRKNTNSDETETGAGLSQPQEQESSVNWKLFINIIYAWVVTVPVSAALSAAFMFTLTKIVL